MTHADATQRARPLRALFAWEFGAGRTHAVNILGVAARLQAQGVECAATLYEPSFAAEFANAGIPVVQNYVWPARRRAGFPWQERETRSLGDVLANLGFADERALGAALGHYEGLFALFRPDVVLAENAFGALLAARGRMPALAFGNHSCLPPVKGTGFATRIGAPPSPAWPEDELARAIDGVLAATGRPPLGELAALLRDVPVLPYGPAPFDIFRESRTVPVLPVHLPGIERPVPESRGDEIFAYLHDFAQGEEGVTDALERIGRPMRLHMPGIAPLLRQHLVACGVTVEDAPVPPAEIVRRSRCVVHHGGLQLTVLCLAAGIPQVILAKELDNVLAGDFVARAGLGLAAHLKGVGAEATVRAVHRAFDDAAMKQRCLARRTEFGAWLEGDPSATVARAAMEELGHRHD